MSDHKSPSPEYVAAFAGLFDGRRDAHGEGLGRRVDEAVTVGVYRDHLIGKRRIGIYCVAGPSMDRVKFGAIDIDIPDWELACLLADRLKHYGIASQIERTKSKGWHVWFFFATWVEAWKVRAVVRTAIKDLGDRVPGPLEVFPKQDRVPLGGYGNYINLPLFGGDVREGRTCFHVAGDDGRPRLVTDWTPDRVELTPESTIDEIIELTGETAPSAAPARAYERGAAEAPLQRHHDGLLPCAMRMYQDGAGEGSRNEWCFRLAIHFKRNGFAEAQAHEIMARWNTRNRPPMPESELKAAVASAYDPKHHNESLGCDNPLITPVCALSECPVYRRNHPGLSERDNSATPPEVTDAIVDGGIKLVNENYDSMTFEFRRDDLIYRLSNLDNRRGAMTGIVVVERGGKALFRGQVNLESDTRRRAVDKAVYEMSGKQVTDVGRDLMNAAHLVSLRLTNRANEIREKENKAKQGYVMTAAEEEATRKWIESDHRILYRMIEATSAAGMVREKRNRLVLYLLATSRKMHKPISGIGKGDSSSGKSYLAGEIFKLIPEEDYVEFTRITAAALEYRGEYALVHKLLFVREAPGSEDSQHSLRTMISEGDLRLTTAEKNESGRIESRDVVVRGPLAFYTTTTMIEVNAENETRFFTVPSDESEAMTAACLLPLAYIAKKGPMGMPAAELLQWRNFQRMLKTGQDVVVPFADRLTAGFPTQNIRSRRDFARMLELIKACAFLHQHHRAWTTTYDSSDMPVKTYVASVADYAIVKSVIGSLVMRAAYAIKPGQQELLAQLQSSTEMALEYRNRGELDALDKMIEVEVEDGTPSVWIGIPYLRRLLGKTHRAVVQLVKALEEEGLLEARMTRRPPRVRMIRSPLADGEFFLPTIDPETLYEEYPDDRKHAYDPLLAPDFEDLYGTPENGWTPKVKRGERPQ